MRSDARLSSVGSSMFVVVAIAATAEACPSQVRGARDPPGLPGLAMSACRKAVTLWVLPVM